MNGDDRQTDDERKGVSAHEAADRLRSATFGAPLLVVGHGERRFAVYNDRVPAGHLSFTVQRHVGGTEWSNGLFVNLHPEQLVRLAVLLAEVLSPRGAEPPPPPAGASSGSHPGNGTSRGPGVPRGRVEPASGGR